jgi:hypothetical protein
LAVTRAIEQLIRCGRRLRFRRAHHRQHVAVGRIHHHQRPVRFPRRAQMPRQNFGGTQLQPCVHRQMHAAIPRQNPRHAFVPRMVPIADQRRQLRVLVTLQLAIRVVFHQRGVRGVKVFSGA